MFQSATGAAPATVSTDAPSKKTSNRLPPSAQNKLKYLQKLRDDAFIMYEAAQDELNRLRGPGNDLGIARRELTEIQNSRNGTLPMVRAAQARIEAIEAELAAARALVKQHSDQFQDTARIVARIEEFLSEETAKLEEVKTETPPIGKIDDAKSEIAKLRDLIPALRADRMRIETAAVPATEAKEQVRAFVAKKAAQVAVGGLLSRGSQIGIRLPKDEPELALACFLDPNAVIRRLEKEIDAEIGDRKVMTELEQARELKKLDEKLLATARKEEALVVSLEKQGVTFARRTNADPRAVLGVE